MTTINKKLMQDFLKLSKSGQELLLELSTISEEALEKTLEENYTIVEDNNNLRKIAFILENGSSEKIIISSENNEFHILSGKEKFLANMLSNEENIELSIKQADNLFLNSFSLSEDDIEHDVSIKKNNTLSNSKIEWKIEEETINNTWGNVEFILQKLRTDYYSMRKWKNLIKSAIWEDENSCNKLVDYSLKHNISGFVPMYILASDKVWQNVENETDFFNRFSNLELIKVYLQDMKNKTNFEILLERAKNRKNSSYSSFDKGRQIVSDLVGGYKTYDIETKKQTLEVLKDMHQFFLEQIKANSNKINDNKELLSDSEQIKNNIDILENDINKNYSIEDEKNAVATKFIINRMRELFADKNWLLSRKQLISRHYELLSNEMQSNLDIIKSALDVKEEAASSLLNNIPEDVFTNIKSSADIFKIATDKDIYMNNQVIDNISKHIDTPEKFIEFFKQLEILDAEPNKESVCKLGNLEKIYKSDKLPKKIKENKEIIKLLLECDINIYHEIPKKLRSNKEIITVCINKGNARQIDNDILFKVKDNNLIEEIIKQYDELMLCRDVPAEWKNNKNLILQVSDKNFFKNYKEDDWDNLTNNEIEKYKQLILRNNDTYDLLPEKIRKNKDLTLLYIENLGYPGSASVPNRLWSNREFCMKAITIDADYMSNVPEYFWSDKTFVVYVCQLMDSLQEKSEESTYELDKIKNNLPDKVKQYFDTLGITSNYNSFIMNLDLSSSLENKQIKTRNNKI